MTTEAHTLHKPRRARRLAGRSATVAAVAAVLTVGGIAAANWIVDGSGTGSAGATESIDLDVSLEISRDESDQALKLYPGATLDGDLIVTNPNAFAIQITEVTFDPSDPVTVTPAEGKTCGSDDHKVTISGATGLTLIVAAGDENFRLEEALAGAFTMGTDAANGCQGATFAREFSVEAEIYVAP